METSPEKNKGGRPPGAVSKLSREARELARGTGKMPHEILLEMARGPFEHYVDTGVKDAEGTVVYVKQLVLLDIDQRRDAAKAAAPYYAPKLSAVETIGSMAEDELDAIIAGAAAEAGVGLGAAGEGAEGEAEEAGGGVEAAAPRARRIVPD